VRIENETKGNLSLCIDAAIFTAAQLLLLFVFKNALARTPLSGPKKELVYKEDEGQTLVLRVKLFIYPHLHHTRSPQFAD